MPKPLCHFQLCRQLSITAFYTLMNVVDAMQDALSLTMQGVLQVCFVFKRWSYRMLAASIYYKRVVACNTVAVVVMACRSLCLACASSRSRLGSSLVVAVWNWLAVDPGIINTILIVPAVDRWVICCAVAYCIAVTAMCVSEVYNVDELHWWTVDVNLYYTLSVLFLCMLLRFSHLLALLTKSNSQTTRKFQLLMTVHCSFFFILDSWSLSIESSHQISVVMWWWVYHGVGRIAYTITLIVINNIANKPCIILCVQWRHSVGLCS